MGVFNRVVPVAVFAITLVGCAGRTVSADGPYSGRVVDTETKQPLAGAVVLAIWMKYVPVGAHMPESFVDAVEVVTDASGQFSVPAKAHVVLFGSLQEPDFVIFSPGYGYMPLHQRQPTTNVAKELLKHATVELPRWKTREERLRVRSVQSAVSRVPAEKMPKLIELVNTERTALGLAPEHLGRGTP